MRQILKKIDILWELRGLENPLLTSSNTDFTNDIRFLIGNSLQFTLHVHVAHILTRNQPNAFITMGGNIFCDRFDGAFFARIRNFRANLSIFHMQKLCRNTVREEWEISDSHSI